MYVFLIAGLPLGFLLVYLKTFPREDFIEARRAFLRGMIAFIPTWIAARLLSPLVPAAYGSFLLTFHELAGSILPFVLVPGASYLVFYRLKDDRGHGFLYRRLTAFYAGALAPVGLCEMTIVWGRPDAHSLFILPFILFAIMMAAPRAILALRDGYGLGLALSIAAIVAGMLALSLGPWLFLAHLWPLSLAIAAGAVVAAWLLATPELSRRPPRPLVG